MRLVEITKARRSTIKNVRKAGHARAVEVVHELISNGVTNIGVRMSNIPKLGLNPRSEYDTPYGLCFYPGEYYLKTKEANEELPFLDDANYIEIFRYDTDKILHVNDISKEQAITMVQMLAKFSDKRLNNEHDVYQLWDKSKTDALVPSLYGGRIWYVTYILSNDYPVLWNKMLRLGLDQNYDMILDHGAGIIHEMEPWQGLMLTTKDVTHIDEIKQTHRSMQHWDMDHWFKNIGMIKGRLSKKNEQYMLNTLLDSNNSMIHSIMGEIMNYWNNNFNGEQWPEIEQFFLANQQQFMPRMVEYMLNAKAYDRKLATALTDPTHLWYAIKFALRTKKPFREIEHTIAHEILQNSQTYMEFIKQYLSKFYNINDSQEILNWARDRVSQP